MLLSLKRFDNNQEELEAAKGQVVFLQKSFQATEAANLWLKEEVSSLTSKLSWANFKCNELGHKILRLQ